MIPGQTAINTDGSEWAARPAPCAETTLWHYDRVGPVHIVSELEQLCHIGINRHSDFSEQRTTPT
jgi:hypothetical protein